MQKAVLRDMTLAISVARTFKCRSHGMDVTTIKCANGILEKGPELWVQLNFLGN
jgi:hypothetical protein